MEFQKDIDALLAPLSYLQNVGEGGENSDGTAKEAFLKLMQTLCDLITEIKFMKLLEDEKAGSDIDRRMELAEAEYRTALGGLRTGDPGLVSEEVRLAREIAQVYEQIQMEQKLADSSDEEVRRLEQRIAELSAPKQSITAEVEASLDLTLDDIQAEQDLKFLRDVSGIVETALGVSVQSVEDGRFALGIGKYTVTVVYDKDTSKVADLSVSPEPPQNVYAQAEKTLYLNDIPEFVLCMKRNPF